VQRDIKKAIAAGFVDYITKPLKVSAFLQALDTALLLSQKNRSPITTTTITTPTKETA
jgi:CheY-like chemotaxis protein